MPLVRKSPPPAAPPPPPGDDGLTLGSVDERRAAALAMTAEADVPALRDALDAEREPAVCEAILTSLGRIGTEAAAAAVTPGIWSDDARVRRGALDALRAMPQAVSPLMEGLLLDTDPDVRLLSCEIARDLPGGRATALMSALLGREAEANVCASAIDVLIDIGTTEALPALRAVALRFADEPFLAFAANAAIERIAASADTPGE